MNKGFWMANGSSCFTDCEMAYDNSARIEPKRSQQWFMDGTEAELFPNKKQALEAPIHNLFCGPIDSNVSPWGNASNFHSVMGQFTERLYEPETARANNFDDRNIPSVGTGNITTGRKVIDDPLGSDSSFGLSISHQLEDPRSGLYYGGIRKVKVSEVKDSENFMPVSIGHAYNRGDNITMSAPHAYGKADDNVLSMGLSLNRGDDNIISMGNTYNSVHNNFISIGQLYSNGDDNTLAMGHHYLDNNSGISIGSSISKDEDNITTMGQTFTREEGNNISMGNAFKDSHNIISLGQYFSKGNDSIPSIDQSFNKGDENAISMGNLYNKVDVNSLSMGHAFNKVENNALSLSSSFGKGESNIISFGGFQNDDGVNSSGRLMSSYDLLMGHQSSAQRPEAPSEKSLVESNVDAIVSAANVASPASETVSKKNEDKKKSKKVPSNNFPSNVKSLLSTGMLDGVPVKYVAWSREELCGIVKDSGYLCGCQSCNFSKVINAYEFERHAGCKTKHPNNHIYFENGKTIYGIVQELKNTPQDLLFEVIQTITGSPINEKAFRVWKDSFVAASRELQRIYGNNEGKQHGNGEGNLVS